MSPADGFVEVPDFVGLTVDAALTYADSLGICIQGTEPDGPPILGLSGTVVGQRPAAGDIAEPDEPVILSIESDGGGAAVREPRRPLPPHGSLGARPSD